MRNVHTFFTRTLNSIQVHNPFAVSLVTAKSSSAHTDMSRIARPGRAHGRIATVGNPVSAQHFRGASNSHSRLPRCPSFSQDECVRAARASHYGSAGREARPSHIANIPLHRNPGPLSLRRKRTLSSEEICIISQMGDWTHTAAYAACMRAYVRACVRACTILMICTRFFYFPALRSVCVVSSPGVGRTMGRKTVRTIDTTKERAKQIARSLNPDCCVCVCVFFSGTWTRWYCT